MSREPGAASDGEPTDGGALRAGRRSAPLARRRLGLRLRQHWFSVAAWATLGVAVGLRVVGLDHLPGINADEAYTSFQAWQLLRGERITFETGTGLPINPLYTGVSLVAHALGGVSPTVLRVPSLVFGVLAIAVGVALFGRQLGRRTGLLFGTLLGCMPIAIAYARFSWDTSITPFVSVLWLWAGLRRQWLALLGCGVLALWVHPVNVFLAPAVFAPWLWQHYRGLSTRRSRRLAWVLATGLLVVGLAAPFVASRLSLPGPLGKLAFSAESLAGYVERLRHPLGLLRFARLFGDLLSGVTLYTFITGGVPEGSRLWHAAALATLCMPLWVLGAASLRREADERIAPLFAGFLLSLVLAYALGGPRLLTPHSERYGMFLVAPTCLLSARFLVTLARGRPAARAALEAGTLALCLAQLASFTVHYFGPLTAAQTRSHLAFRTGARDPKWVALDRIDAERDASRPTYVLTDGWWSYWPIRYGVGARSGYHVTIAGEPWDRRFPLDYRLPPGGPPAQAEVFGVAFVESRFERWLSSRFGAPALEVRGYASAPILRVYRMSP